MKPDIIVIGSGMGSLAASAMLASEGAKVLILEQNWIPGGCTTSYWRKGFVFEAGATTLVGLDEGMPLHFLLKKTGIELQTRKLDLPMQVHFEDFTVNRYQEWDRWISEVSHHFPGNQAAFWQEACKTSQFVWDASTRYTQFPPARLSDWVSMAKAFKPSDLSKARYSLKTTASVLEDYDLADPAFNRFVNEQLMITAQNQMKEVNFLFGAAALCYTNYGNYYIDGGLINLVNPILDYIRNKGGSIQFREGVRKIQKVNNSYIVYTNKGSYKSDLLISGIPINNTLELLDFKAKHSISNKLMGSEKIFSALQMGIGFKTEKEFSSLHHQIILDKPMVSTGSQSIFLSLNHPKDHSRSDAPGHRVASVSTHISEPEHTQINKEDAAKEIIEILNERGFLTRSQIVYSHISTQHSWQKWTGRKHGFVGGYPQYAAIKPWQMLESRLDDKGAYLCGDTTYPGQGIPGATLSGIIAATKIIADHF